MFSVLNMKYFSNARLDIKKLNKKQIHSTDTSAHRFKSPCYITGLKFFMLVNSIALALGGPAELEAKTLLLKTHFRYTEPRGSWTRTDPPTWEQASIVPHGTRCYASFQRKEEIKDPTQLWCLWSKTTELNNPECLSGMHALVEINNSITELKSYSARRKPRMILETYATT